MVVRKKYSGKFWCLKIGISFFQALLISDTSYDLEKLDEEEAGEADDQSEEGDYQILKKLWNCCESG